MPDEASFSIEIDASDVFGTGLHASSSLCLERISELSPIESLLDVGTGSGVLAIAALALGAGRVAACDHDPRALEAAEANAARNRVSDRLALTSSLAEARFEVIVANINFATLMSLAPELVRRLGHRGVLLLSGVQTVDVEELAGVYVRLGLHRIQAVARDDWSMIELEASW